MMIMMIMIMMIMIMMIMKGADWRVEKSKGESKGESDTDNNNDYDTIKMITLTSYEFW